MNFEPSACRRGAIRKIRVRVTTGFAIVSLCLGSCVSFSERPTRYAEFLDRLQCGSSSYDVYRLSKEYGADFLVCAPVSQSDVAMKGPFACHYELKSDVVWAEFDTDGDLRTGKLGRRAGQLEVVYSEIKELCN